MSYRGKSKGSYGQQKQGKSGFHGFGRGKRDADTLAAQRNFESRSRRSQKQDLMKFAEIAPNITVYLHAPNEFDWRGVDAPDPHLIFENKNNREKARDLATLATKAKNVEMWVRDTSESDLKGVDTPGSKSMAVKPKTKRFRVIKKTERKAEVEKELKKQLEKPKEPEKQELKAENNPIKEESEHKLPSEEEIYNEAVRMWQKENASARHEDFMPSTAPTRGELQEEGLLRAAQLSLMTNESTVANRQTMDYIESVRSELNRIGFDVIPISGFSVEDLQ